MADFEAKLAELFRAGSEDGEEAEARVRHHAAAAIRRRARRSRIVAGAAGAASALAAVVSLNVAGVLGDTDAEPGFADIQEPRGDANAAPDGVVDVGEPCEGARHSDLPNLDTSVPVWLPADRAPSSAWTCGQEGQGLPVLMFGDIQVSYEPGYDQVEPTQYVETVAKEFGGYTMKLGDHTAAVVPSVGGDVNHEVDIVVNGTMVRLLAEASTPIDDVVALAKSLQLPNPKSDMAG